jgi:ATP-dependent helicase/DNAse subunit B
MKVLAANGDMDAIKAYLDELDTDLNTVDTVVKTGNAMADAILNSKISLAQSKCITVHCDAHIPVKLKKDGSLQKSAPVQSLEEFGALMRDVEHTVAEITMEMKHGCADAVPISVSASETGRDPCAYCAMKMVCRGGVSGHVST